MRVLISWETDDNDNNDVGINADSSRVGGGIRPPSSRRCACRATDLMVRDASYGDLRTPLHKAVAGSRPLAAQLLVHASRPCGMLWEAMRARDALGRTLLESVRAYASIPPNKVETEGAWVWQWEAAAGGAGANLATCLRLLECASAATNVACDGACFDGGIVDRVWGGVSSFRAAN